MSIPNRTKTPSPSAQSPGVVIVRFVGRYGTRDALCEPRKTGHVSQVSVEGSAILGLGGVVGMTPEVVRQLLTFGDC